MTKLLGTANGYNIKICTKSNSIISFFATLEKFFALTVTENILNTIT